MSPVINEAIVQNAAASSTFLVIGSTATTFVPLITPSINNKSNFLFPFRNSSFNAMNNYLVLSQNIFLIVSNFFMLPAIFLAVRFRFRGEAIIYLLSMISSSLYHLCDNKKLNYCIARFETLQFFDFYCAILTLWVTAIILANIPIRWISSYHLGGAVFFALLLRNNAVGFLTFIVPAFCSVTLLLGYWGYKYFVCREVPALIRTRYFMVACAFTAFGIVLFALQQQDWLLVFYGFTHSLWHVCMALAITFLLPNRNRGSPFFYREQRYSMDNNIPREDALSKRNDDYNFEQTQDNFAFNGEEKISRNNSTCSKI